MSPAFLRCPNFGKVSLFSFASPNPTYLAVYQALYFKNVSAPWRLPPDNVDLMCEVLYPYNHTVAQCHKSLEHTPTVRVDAC